jgi:surface antigen
MVGSILVLHRDVQGASSAGHVAIVEQILSNGTVIASSMNWGKHPGAVTNSLFHSGYGVSFIH